MNFRNCKTDSEFKNYIKFIKEHYKNDPYYVDYLTPIIKEVFAGQSPFAKNLWFEAYFLEEAGTTLGVVTYLIHKNYENVLQIAFLEYVNVEGIPALIIEKAQEACGGKHIQEIVIGLNGHVNYGLGLSLEQIHRPTFGAAYTKTYYSEHFKMLNFEETRLVSFQYPWAEKTFPLSEKKIKRFQKRFQFRVMNKKSYDQDIKLYTELNNQCFGEHPFYFSRTEEEDRFLFKDLKFFLEKGSLIFAEDAGKPIGFLLWYPDWGELMKQGETLSHLTFLKKCLFHKKVKGFKIVEWAVLPQYRQKGVPIGLLAHCYEQVVHKKYSQCKTSWIIEDNKNSSGFGDKWAQPYEKYAVYTLKVK